MSDDERNTDTTATEKGLTRKERQKIEKQEKFQRELEAKAAAAHNVNKDGDNPFSVTLEEGAVPHGTRDISLKQVSVTVNGKTLFQNTAVKFSAGSRYGLMGPNGRGKSTILRLMSTHQLPVPEGLDILLVEQEQEFHASELSAVEAVIQSHKQQQEYLAEAEMLRNKADMTDEELERLQFLEDELQVMGAEQAESKARRILFGLGFPTEWHDRPTTSFSGGWRKRIALASAVFIEPDVLLLDEPTNHLDLNAVIWLDQYLAEQYSESAKKKKTLIVVSHDAGFLDSVCSHMVLIENFKLHYFGGGYGKFAAQVNAMHAEYDKKFETYEKQIKAKRTEKGGMSSEQIEDWIRQQVNNGRMEEEFLNRRRDYIVNFPFSSPGGLRDACLVKLDDVAFNYPGGPELFRGVSCSLWADSRITLCGPNGIGKSTLLNLMTGGLEPTAGHVNVNRQMRIGRYNQHFVDKLPLEKTPVEIVQSFGIDTETAARSVLGRFGLEGIVHHNQVATLSGGQKARVAFAAIAVEKPHFLLLDEPTNHLDVEAIEALCAAINNFEGGVLVVTHDSRLITQTNMAIWVAGNKTVTPFPGDLSDYKAYVKQLVEAEDARREGLKAVEKVVKADKKISLEEQQAIEQEKINEGLSGLAALRAKKKEKDAKKDKKEKEAKKEKKDKV